VTAASAASAGSLSSPAHVIGPPPAARDGGDWRAITLAIAILAGLSILCAVTSQGFLEADGCSHYLYARFAFAEPSYFVNVWGRPIVTALYAMPAVIGRRLGVRFMSLAVAVACAFVARSLAKEQGLRRPALALIFTVGQPLVFLHSFSELTELPFALMLGLALLAYSRRAFFWMTLLVAFMPACRPEGFALLAVAAAALVFHRRWALIALLPAGVLIWNVAGWILYGRSGVWWHWLGQNWPYAAQSLYQPGSLAHFVMLMPAVTSPLVFPATCIGIALSLRPWRQFFSDHLSRCMIVTAAVPLGILAGHSLLYWTGRMASSGELRYMLTAAPLWGVLADRGWEWAAAKLSCRGPVIVAGVAVLAAALVNNSYRVLPVGLDVDWLRARDIAQWYQTWPGRSRYPAIMTAHPGIYYFLDQSMVGPGSREWKQSAVAAAPPGTLLVWDSIYGVYNSDQNRSVSLAQIKAAGWIEGIGPSRSPAELAATMSDNHWHIFHSPRPAGQ
jgi:hypothetical protein